jgi:hypothetical protein
MEAKVYGGIDIAMKVPPLQYHATIAFYRDVIGLQPIPEEAPAIGFEFGLNTLWIDEAPGMSQAEIWLELFNNNIDEAAAHLAKAGLVRCDLIEPLPDGFKGGWITTPANFVHMVREPDAW